MNNYRTNTPSLQDRLDRPFSRLERFWESVRWYDYNSALPEIGTGLIIAATFYRLGVERVPLEAIPASPLVQAVAIGLLAARSLPCWLKSIARDKSERRQREVTLWAPRFGLLLGLFAGFLCLVAGWQAASMFTAAVSLGCTWVGDMALPAWRSMWAGAGEFQGEQQ